MKLMTKAAWLHGAGSLLALLLAGRLTHWFLEKTFDDEATQQLRHERLDLERHAARCGRLPRDFFSLTDTVLVVTASKPRPEQLRDTVLYNHVEQEPLRYRQLSFDVKTGSGLVRVTIQKALYETEDLAEALLVGALGLVLLLTLALGLTNYGLSRRLWRPFYRSLDTLRTFRLNQAGELWFAPTDTTEFKALQASLTTLTRQAQRDYQSLKVFTENAAHELQTPLAVLRAKLELLLQTETLGENPTRQVAELLDAVGRLTRLNQSLLLLTKIENRQFPERQNLHLAALVEEKLDFLSDLISFKALHLRTDLDDAVRVPMHPHLAEVLLSNLLSNAIRHNLAGGEIRVRLRADSLEIRNTGPAPPLPTERLWERFRKARPDTESPGLGLSLVREIAQAHGFSTRYDYVDGWHTVRIGF